ncbi:hypothetical protein [Spirosoma areae]
MKKILSLYLILISFLTSAQVVYQPVSATVSGTVVKKIVARNKSIYPLTPTGNTAFLTAVNTGTLPLKAVPAEGSIVGRYTYAFSDSRQDYLNRAVQSAPAPVLADGVRTVPRLVGNYYPMAPQTALNTALYKRFPAFTPHASKVIIYPGGLFNDASDNALTSRGWTHTSESAHWIDGQTYPTQYRRALELANYAAAYNAAQTLPNSDPRKQKLLDWAGPLPAFEGNHLFIDDEETAKLYAQFWWNTFKQNDWKGAGVDYFSVNHEIFVERQGTGLSYYQQWFRQIGWLTKEIIRLAALEGVTLKSGMSDFGNLTHLAPYFFDDNDPATGYPKYMSYGYIHEPYRGSSQSAPMGTPSDIGQLVKEGKAFTGVGSYVQHTFDEQSLFEKNTNGTYKIGSDGGLIWRTDVRNTTITGQTTVLYNEDAYKSQLKFYGIFARYCANQFFRAGGVHLPLSTDRQTGFENVRLLRQFRLDAEAESGITPQGTGTTQQQYDLLNERPLNPDWTEADAMGMYLFNDYLRGWMATQPKSNLGSSTIAHSRASVEMYSKGFHRASQLNWIFDTPWRLVQPKLWIKNQGIVSSVDPNEQFYRKPIITGGIATKDGKPTLWLYWWWPCQDVDRYTDVTVWVDKGAGAVSPGYRIRLKGRKAGLEYWRLPDAAAGLAPRDIYFQFKSLLGEKITWRGDYREARITSHPTPPAIQESELTGSTSPPPTVACSFSVANGTQTSGCSSAVTLTSTVSGPDATGLTYSWSGNNLSASNQSVNTVSLTAPNANGQYTYTVTVAKSGCTSKTATRVLTVSGCGGGGGGTVAYNKPDFDNFDYTPITTNPTWPSHDFTPNPHTNTEAYWSGDVGDYAELSNGIVTVRIHRKFGAAPTHISVWNGPNLVNIHDLGTMNGYALYRGGRTTQSDNIEVATQWAHRLGTYAPDPPGPGTGNDPIQHGSYFGNSSEVVAIGRTDDAIYTKTHMRNWAVNDEYTDVYLEQWVSLDGRGIHIHTKWTNNRQDDKLWYFARQQEYPCGYFLGNHRYAHYVGANGTREMVTGHSDQFGIFLREPFVAMLPSTNPNDVGIGLWAEGMYKGAQWQKNQGEIGDQFENGSGYTANLPIMHVDWDGVYYAHHAFIVGNFDQQREWANAHPDPRNKVSWKFNNRNGRGLFWYENASDTGYPTPETGIELTVTKNSDYGFWFPRFALQATQVPDLYIRYKASAGYPSAGTLYYAKSLAFDWTGNQHIDYNLTVDNNWHTLRIPVNQNSDWNGLINQIHLTAPGAPVGAKFQVQWINTVDAEPTENGSVLLLLAAGGLFKRRKKTYGIRANKPKTLINHGKRNLSRND